MAYGTINPVEAREIFLRSALVEGQWRTRHHVLRGPTPQLRAEAEELEERTRRRDLVVDDETIFAFYDARIPAGITSAAHFDAWWKQARPDDPDLLTLTLVRPDGDRRRAPIPTDFPVSLAGRTVGELALDYVFDPGPTRRRGDACRCRWPCSTSSIRRRSAGRSPGCGTELATELIRSLPKAVRRNLVPAPEYADRALGWLAEHPPDPAEPLPVALGRALRALTGELVERSATGTWRRCRTTCG